MTICKPGAFVGQTVSREMAGTLLSEVRHVRPVNVASHSHEASYFSLLLEGSYSEWSADFAMRYEPYTVVYHKALTEHSDAIGDGGCRMFFVELLSSWTEADSTLSQRPHLFEMDGSAPAWLILKLHREFLCGDAHSPLTVESIVFELLEYVADRPPDTGCEPPWIATTEELLRARLSGNVDLRAIAHETNVHPAHLCRAFRRFRHRTIGDFVTGLRVQLVCRKLDATRETLGDISAQAGFADQSHMTRVFKRITGLTPALYRRQSRSGRPQPR